MIEEAAGTRMYETKKMAAYKTMEKKDKKVIMVLLQFLFSHRNYSWMKSTICFKRRSHLILKNCERTGLLILSTRKPEYEFNDLLPTLIAFRLKSSILPVLLSHVTS